MEATAKKLQDEANRYRHETSRLLKTPPGVHFLDPKWSERKVEDHYRIMQHSGQLGMGSTAKVATCTSLKKEDSTVYACKKVNKHAMLGLMDNNLDLTKESCKMEIETMVRPQLNLQRRHCDIYYIMHTTT